MSKEETTIKTNGSPCAFIVTFPDAHAVAAHPAARIQQQIRAAHPHASYHATTDPAGARLGSGGGTFAALSGHEQNNVVTIVIHAGGASSRCPTQMVLGKAWTTLGRAASPNDDCTSSCSLTTPLEQWIANCHEWFSTLPVGSIVVVAADCLVELPDVSCAWKDHFLTKNDDAVLGVAVPVPFHIAKNHGVYILEKEASTTANFESSFVVPCQKVLQKPTIEVLSQQHVHDKAWMDTGIVIFPPTAAAAFRSLPLQDRYTTTGLMDRSGHEPGPSLDLYTHILHGLRDSSDNNNDDDDKNSRNRYLQAYNEHLGFDLASAIFDVMHRHALHIWAVPGGKFGHLGKTRELQDFVVRSGSVPEFGIGGNRHLAVTLNTTSVGCDAVVLESIVETGVIGEGSVLEHCDIDEATIGNDCLVSGVRNQSITVPNHCMVQQLSVHGKSGYMVLGIDDGIKTRHHLFGKNWLQFLVWANISESELWDVHVAEKTLWDAKLHPIVVSGLFMDYYLWLTAYCEGRSLSEADDASLSRWKACRRLSLAEIRVSGDAETEFSYREELRVRRIPNKKECHLKRVQQVLESGLHEQVNFEYIVAEYLTTFGINDVASVLGMLYGVTDRAAKEETHSVCSRACLILEDFLCSLKTSTAKRRHDPISCIYEAFTAKTFRTNLFGNMDALELLLSARPTKNNMTPTTEELACWIGQLGQIATGKFVARLARNPFSEPISEVTTQHRQVTMGQWVVAVAPARIDLAGGWSDTPPVCFEYGSTVVGVAVAIDRMLPLSCRCRVVPNSQGIFLCSESRTLQSGEMESSMECFLTCFGDLSGWDRPRSKCALQKCALVCMGIATESEVESGDADKRKFQDKVNAFVGSFEVDCRLEVLITSLLPHGSGMGSSSILGGCCFAALAKCMGDKRLDGTDGVLDTGKLVDAVVILEQRLSTGGGFQDQVNGLIGGVKVSHCRSSNNSPIQLEIQRLSVPDSVRRSLDSRLVLAFTGQTRLAKDILGSVLGRWAKRTPEIRETVKELVEGAEKASHAIQCGDLVTLAACFNQYWTLKKKMVGQNSGVEPETTREAVSLLFKHEIISGASLCGAGGGGFLAAIAAEDCQDVVGAIQNDLSCADSAASRFSWHRCNVMDQGVKVFCAADSVEFDLRWHDSAG